MLYFLEYISRELLISNEIMTRDIFKVVTRDVIKNMQYVLKPGIIVMCGLNATNNPYCTAQKEDFL